MRRALAVHTLAAWASCAAAAASHPGYPPNEAFTWRLTITWAWTPAPALDTSLGWPCRSRKPAVSWACCQQQLCCTTGGAHSACCLAGALTSLQESLAPARNEYFVGKLRGRLVFLPGTLCLHPDPTSCTPGWLALGVDSCPLCGCGTADCTRSR